MFESILNAILWVWPLSSVDIYFLGTGHIACGTRHSLKESNVGWRHCSSPTLCRLWELLALRCCRVPVEFQGCPWWTSALAWPSSVSLWLLLQFFRQWDVWESVMQFFLLKGCTGQRVVCGCFCLTQMHRLSTIAPCLGSVCVTLQYLSHSRCVFENLGSSLLHSINMNI